MVFVVCKFLNLVGVDCLLYVCFAWGCCWMGLFCVVCSMELFSGFASSCLDASVGLVDGFAIDFMLFMEYIICIVVLLFWIACGIATDSVFCGLQRMWF